jgi:hypothetical protein
VALGRQSVPDGTVNNSKPLSIIKQNSNIYRSNPNSESRDIETKRSQRPRDGKLHPEQYPSQPVSEHQSIVSDVKKKLSFE